MKKAVQDAMDIIHPLHKSTHTSEEDFASQLHELEEDLKGLRQDVDHMKVSDPTETLATRFQNPEDRVATLGKARIATFNALRSSAPQLPSVAGILPASAPMTGLENSDKDLEKMLERSTEFTEQLKAIRRDHSQLKNTVKELETQKLSLETEQKELEVKYQGVRRQCLT